MQSLTQKAIRKLRPYHIQKRMHRLQPKNARAPTREPSLSQQ